MFRHSAASVDSQLKDKWEGSLPRAWRETKLVTNVKEKDVDDVVIKQRQQLVSAKSPAELASIRGLQGIILQPA
jgi:hypothetical protein